MLQAVGKALHDLGERRIALPAIARQLEVERLEMQLVAIAAAIQAESQYHGNRSAPANSQGEAGKGA